MPYLVTCFSLVTLRSFLFSIFMSLSHGALTCGGPILATPGGEAERLAWNHYIKASIIFGGWLWHRLGVAWRPLPAAPRDHKSQVIANISNGEDERVLLRLTKIGNRLRHGYYLCRFPSSYRLVEICMFVLTPTSSLREEGRWGKRLVCVCAAWNDCNTRI